MIPVSEALRTAMMRHGLTPPPTIEPETFRRFPGADKDRHNTAGWLKVRADGSAVFGDLSRDLSESWHPHYEKPLTRAELEALKREADAHKRDAEAAKKAAEERTAKRARNVWDGIVHAAADHPYLVAKNIKAHGIGQQGLALAVPMYDPADGALRNIQWIDAQGNKRFMKDGRKKGLCFLMDGTVPEANGVLLLAEGFATAASCREATGNATACAFDAGNLRHVAVALRSKYPAAKIVLCADNDESGTGEKAAAEAAADVGGLVAIPPREGYDWNDIHTAEGLDAVRAGITAAHEPEPADDGVTVQAEPESAREPAPWPAPLAKEAYHGILGEIVDLIEPQTEADPMAILLQTIVFFGATVGRGPYVRVESDQHHAALYAVIVGESAKARKGTSAGRVKEIFRHTKFWPGTVEGLSSGEGLKYHVRDAREEDQYDKKSKSTETVLVDPGVTDKRLLVMESEFVQALRQTGRSGNTLSPTVRAAWDSGELRTLTKNDPIVATGAHICIVGHITIPELRAELTATDTANGFANRFLFALVRRSKLLPFGGDPIEPEKLIELATRLNAAVEHARTVQEVQMTEAARAVWAGVYAELSQSRPGLLGAATARSEAQALRLALVYALADCSSVIDAPHLLAAFSIIEYAQASAAYIFGDSLGDPVADELLAALRRSGKAGMTRTTIRDLLGRHQRAERINAALELLASRGLARKAEVRTDGRPSEVWRAATKEPEATKGSIA